MLYRIRVYGPDECVQEWIQNCDSVDEARGFGLGAAYALATPNELILPFEVHRLVPEKVHSTVGDKTLSQD